ncbi:hypothetical protein HETIRDRAFT_426913 [Heterobasidion irregulare TC 32-1]|uniref:Uncharacterized protein n=1 Tax=Heterobasidion irregulare (strain TC 32-1) TaxID=747525 RepID=W4K6Z6_HETIT|nr:uncharacterized protein HETIRDRAFT_426913 [Heterobasidion irregulare TC 32-1]ETW81524.1 hypothetical protein HETIRDRAFT_426913 [Heterobasidion irregulare TC 32-1]
MASRQLCIPSSRLESLVYQEFTFISQYLAIVATSSLFYGFQAILFFLSTYIMSTRNKASLQTRAVLWGVTFVMFGASTADYALGFVHDRIFILNMQSYFLERSSNPVYPMMLFELQAVKPLLQARLFAPIINFVICDAIILWRAWVLWNYSLVVLLISSVCMLGAVGTGLFTLAERRMFFAAGGSMNIGMYGLSIATLGTNVVGTALIAYRAWQLRRQITSNISGSQHPRTKVQKILIFLVESGALYVVIWGRLGREADYPLSFIKVLFILSQSGIFSDLGRAIMGRSMTSIAGVYPTTIIVLVALQQSTSEMTVISPSRTLSLRFVSRDSRSASIPQCPRRPSSGADAHADTSTSMGVFSQRALLDSQESIITFAHQGPCARDKSQKWALLGAAGPIVKTRSTI